MPHNKLIPSSAFWFISLNFFARGIPSPPAYRRQILGTKGGELFGVLLFSPSRERKRGNISPPLPPPLMSLVFVSKPKLTPVSNFRALCTARIFNHTHRYFTTPSLMYPLPPPSRPHISVGPNA